MDDKANSGRDKEPDTDLPSAGAKADQGQPSQSVFVEWIETTFENYVNFAVWWRQRRLILTEPSVVLTTDRMRLRKTPMQFGIQGAIYIAVGTAILNWTYTHLARLPTEQDRQIATLEKLVADLDKRSSNPSVSKDHGVAAGLVPVPESSLSETRSLLMKYKKELDSQKRPNEFLEHFGSSLTILLSAAFFRALLLRRRRSFPLVQHADRAHLYYLNAALFVPSAAFTLLISSASTLSSAVDPLTKGDATRAIMAAAAGVFLVVAVIPFVAWYVLALRKSATVLSGILGLPERKSGRGSFHGPRWLFRSMITSFMASAIAVAVAGNLLEFVVDALG